MADGYYSERPDGIPPEFVPIWDDISWRIGEASLALYEATENYNRVVAERIALALELNIRKSPN